MKFDNNVPIYIQIVEQLKIFIVSGNINTGERLPSIRELALQLKVNPNTIQKALTELENLELIYTERTNGKFITKNQTIIDNFKYKYASDLSKKYFDNMLSIGFNKKETLEYLEKLGGNER